MEPKGTTSAHALGNEELMLGQGKPGPHGSEVRETRLSGNHITKNPNIFTSRAYRAYDSENHARSPKKGGPYERGIRTTGKE